MGRRRRSPGALIESSMVGNASVTLREHTRLIPVAARRRHPIATSRERNAKGIRLYA